MEACKSCNGRDHNVARVAAAVQTKTVLKYALIEKTNFDIPYVKMKQFNKSHYSLYLGIFSDMGYVIDKQTDQNKR